jgi:PAS domain S-box-containing protein
MIPAPLTRIRFRILCIVLLALIPAAFLICLSAAERKRQVSDAIEGNSIRLSRFLASNLERDLSEGEGYVRAIAELMRGWRIPDGACAKTLRRISGDSSIYSNVGVADRAGRVMCIEDTNARFSGLWALDWFRDLDSAKGFTVGFDFNGGQGSGSSIVMVLPESTDGKGIAGGRRYVFAIMDLEWLNGLAEASHLPPGSAISITNAKGDAVARYPAPEKWVGRSRQPGSDLLTSGDSQGVRFAHGIDGVKRLYAYTKVHGKGDLVVNVGISRESILEPANRALRNQLMALLAVALLSILAAWFGADLFLLKQVRTLIKATKQLGAGNLQARSMLTYDRGELGELARAFDEMAETLEWRDAQLRESEVERAEPLAKLLTLAKYVPEPFVIMDESLSILACNLEASLLFGLSQEELIGQSLQRFFPDVHITKNGSMRTRIPGPEDREVSRFRSEIRFPPKPGHPVHVEISLTKAELTHRPFILALMKQSFEPIPEA